MFRIHPVQYSCTTIQYSFDPAFLPSLDNLASRLGLEVKKDAVSGGAIIAELERISPEREVYISHQCGTSDYRRKERKEEFVDYYKLLCLAKDVDAEISMSFDGTPRHTGFDYCFPKSDYIWDPYWIFVHLTDNCNLNCKYCYSPKEEKEVLLKNLKKFVQGTKEKIKREYKEHWPFSTIRKSPKYGITLGGGEPILHPDFVKIVKYLRKEFDYITVSINGTNLKPLLDCEKLIDGVAISYPFPYNQRLSHLGGASEKQIVRAFKKVSQIPRRILSVIITSKMKPVHISRVIKFAQEVGATGVLFLMFKPLGQLGEKYVYLLPGLWQAREIVAEISREMISFLDKKFEICLDACSLAYTMPFYCSSYSRYFGPEREERIIYLKGFPVCPWGERNDFNSCPFQKIYKAKFTEALLEEKKPLQ